MNAVGPICVCLHFAFLVLLVGKFSSSWGHQPSNRAYSMVIPLIRLPSSVKLSCGYLGTQLHDHAFDVKQLRKKRRETGGGGVSIEWCCTMFIFMGPSRNGHATSLHLPSQLVAHTCKLAAPSSTIHLLCGSGKLNRIFERVRRWLVLFS